ncbi:MAG: hypothetical protein ACJ751_16830 [Niastella sp.]|jgi:hypothetical protein|uniref:hypothetical protein n=1 Tax=Niastella sp. TaxID=1869183 RepID=UPI00389A7AEB
MLFPYVFFIVAGISILFILIRFLIVQKKNIPAELFARALQDENSGHFKEAIITYESALDEVKKIKFNTTLKKKIIEKIKLMHTVIEYQNSHRF